MHSLVVIHNSTAINQIVHPECGDEPDLHRQLDALGVTGREFAWYRRLWNFTHAATFDWQAAARTNLTAPIRLVHITRFGLIAQPANRAPYPFIEHDPDVEMNGYRFYTAANSATFGMRAIDYVPATQHC